MEPMLLQQPDAWEPRGLAGGDGVLGHSLLQRLKPGLSSHRLVAALSLAKAVCPWDMEGSLTWGVWGTGLWRLREGIPHRPSTRCCLLASHGRGPWS